MAQFVLEIVEGAEPGREVPLDRTLEVGRDPGADLVLEDNQVSRRHARIGVSGDQAVVEDAGSRNGTYVNGQATHGPRSLAAGDQIRMGLTVLELRSARQVAAEPSAVRPRPQKTALGAGVLEPVREEDLPAPAPQGPADVPSLLVEESEPAFVAAEASAAGGEARSGYDELAALVDSRVKRQTNVAAFALIAVSALAVIIYFGAR